MQQSVLLCISTILDSGNRAQPAQILCFSQCSQLASLADYTKMMELVDDYGNTVFETIKITLVRTRTWLLIGSRC